MEEHISEEGKQRIEDLKKNYVIDESELDTYRCQSLLQRLYWCHEEMGELLDDGIGDPDYTVMGNLIERLEKHLQHKQDIL